MEKIIVLISFVLSTNLALAGENQDLIKKFGVTCETIKTEQGQPFGAPQVPLPATYFSPGQMAFSLSVDAEEVKILSSIISLGDGMHVTISQTAKKTGEVSSTDAVLQPGQSANLNYFSYSALDSNPTNQSQPNQVVYSTTCTRK
jgi:hypothetical protein